MEKELKIVAIGVGSNSFGRGVIADVLGTPEFNDLKTTLVLVDVDPSALDRMHKLALRLKDHFKSSVDVQSTTDRKQAFPDADYIVMAVAVNRYPLWEQDFRVPAAYGVKHVLGENGGPGAAFHTLRSLHLVLPICQDIEQICPNALLLNYTNPESRVVMGINKLTGVWSVGLCHGVFSARENIAGILGRKLDDLTIVTGGLNHLYWATKITDKQSGEDLYPELKKRLAEKPDFVPPLAGRMLDLFGLYVFPSDDHIGEYISFAHEFINPKWHYGQENRKAPLSAEEKTNWLDVYASGREELSEKVTSPSGEIAIPIILDIELDRKHWEAAVNVPNTGGYVSCLPHDAIVEVPAVVDATGIHPEPIGDLPEALAAICRTQVSIQKLIVEAYQEKSKKLLLQALLIDPCCISVKAAENIIDDLLQLQSDYLPQLN